MAREGDFLVRSDGPHERVFRLRNTELEIDCESISSEWTTDSEAERTIQQEQLGSRGIIEEKQTRRKRKKRAWRLRHWLRRDDDSDSKSSDSDSSSSTSSGSSSSTDGGELGSFKRQRQQVQQQWNIIKGLKSNFSPPLDGPPVLPTEDQPLRNDTEDRPLPRSVSSSGLCWFESSKKYRAFAVAPGFLQQQDIEAISSAAKHSSVREINDRKGYLAFKHRVWRFELQLRALWPDLYARLMAVMRSADEAKWKRLSAKSRKVYPEVEYIEYDVEEMKEPCFIEPHVDNKSAVTLVAMLSPPNAYVGGRSCFRRAQGSRGHRELALEQGDVVLFRGEKLTHWITPVTEGKRVILQIEMSRV
ncbi:Uncharacterized protein SCF082_LOCUS21001 [Durusdinium trenchii]|uniref:Fe2OG dioxygenase domain-containing protein n=1 Tax=Durusdinium trenchii TaxID=1381693 RepID=A0ABP0L6H3_9DINO